MIVILYKTVDLLKLERKVLNVDELLKAAKIMNDHYAKTLHLPIGLKVNKEWFNKQIEDDVIKMSTDKPNSFKGLPVEIDNSIEAYEFIYRDEYQEMIDKAKENLFKPLFQRDFNY